MSLLASHVIFEDLKGQIATVCVKGWTDVTEISFMLLHIKCITINGMLSRSQESMSY